MKPKTSPTSPKAKAEETDHIEKLYKDALNTIEKPSTKVRFSLGWIVFVVVIGFVAGIIGQLTLISFGDQIPFLERFGFTDSSDTASIILTSRNKDTVLTPEQIESIGADMTRTIMRLYPRDDAATTGLDAQYLPADAVAQGLILTNDGYAVFRSDLVSDDVTYVGVTADGSAYAVKTITRDSATPYAFVQFDAQDLTSVGFSDVTQIHDTEEIIAVLPDAVPGQPRILQTRLENTHYRTVTQSSDYVFSAEQYPYSFLLESPGEDGWDGAVAFTLDKKALGILRRVDERYEVAPFVQLDPIMEVVLGGKPLERPQLGVSYVLLDMVNTSLGQGDRVPTSGAYLYSTDTINPLAEDGSAATAGVESGDTITEVDGQPISLTRTLSDFVLTHKVGDTITLTIIRDGESQKINVTLDSQ